MTLVYLGITRFHFEDENFWSIEKYFYMKDIINPSALVNELDSIKEFFHIHHQVLSIDKWRRINFWAQQPSFNRMWDLESEIKELLKRKNICNLLSTNTECEIGSIIDLQDLFLFRMPNFLYHGKNLYYHVFQR